MSAESLVNRRTPVVEAVQKGLPAVVNIGTEKLVKMVYNDASRRFRDGMIDRFFRDFLGPPLPLPALGYKRTHSLGSGVIVDAGGYILTNYHVIERATRIMVTLEDNSTYEARVIAGDELNDLALIKIEPAGPLSPVELTADDDLLLGESVIVLGNPFGLGHTVTVGVLSAKDRQATYQGQVVYSDILQTDAAVNPGSSGGPLLNLDGQLIGVNVVFYKEAQNIGFAVPVKRVRTLLTEWLSPRMISKMRTGLDLREVAEGLMVIAVDPEGPAAETSLQFGDRIVSVNGSFLSSILDLYRNLLGCRPGDRLDLEIDREGARFFVEYRLDAIPTPSGGKLARSRLGLEFSGDKDLFIKALQFSKGLPISAVVEGSVAERTGLKPGLLVTRINNMEIRSLDDVGLALEAVKSGDTVILVVTRIEGTDTYVMAQNTKLQVKAD